MHRFNSEFFFFRPTVGTTWNEIKYWMVCFVEHVYLCIADNNCASIKCIIVWLQHRVSYRSRVCYILSFIWNKFESNWKADHFRYAIFCCCLVLLHLVFFFGFSCIATITICYNFELIFVAYLRVRLQFCGSFQFMFMVNF